VWCHVVWQTYRHCGGTCGFHIQKCNSLWANKQNYEVFPLGQGSQTLSARPPKAVNVCSCHTVGISLYTQTVHVNPTPVPILHGFSWWWHWTPLRTVRLKKLTVAQLVSKFLLLLNLGVHFHVHTSPPLVHTLNHNLTHCFQLMLSSYLHPAQLLSGFWS
jgi:hypothetical protein